MSRWSWRVLRAALVALLLGSLLLQVLLPMLAEEVGGGYTETAHLVAPYAVTAIAAVACLQVALGAVWWLMALVRRDEMLTPRALRGVDVAGVAIVLAAALAASPPAHLLLGVDVGGPGVLIAFAACAAGGVAAALAWRAVRSQLVAAIADRAELAAVV
ncbi:DUF2975 domain-containing protein [Cellulomonas xiejunii]|uniref:DUF2975 domain-containing protein n=1 Tax=Cellulomonas xiejunii TaxID=2968083 RepID=A0ABY5KRU7_9CELL|nr:DUF2975 domain-containing protein [Cellulomonas xiejunii]MCC2321911.1 DUF2975 domain-containing protein [Cellulomonas xiejunii]UUI73212.1 DUF2975 domain-containing protein [Cellulomonas xiejunii]